MRGIAFPLVLIVICAWLAVMPDASRLMDTVLGIAIGINLCNIVVHFLRRA